MVFKNLREEIDTVLKHDPAARSTLEVVFCYPGFHALLFYRVARFLWRHGWLVLGRWVSHLGRTLTGIEIHPGAEIGRRLFIDHGMGVVIGETTVIGDDVTLYQQVTLGGTSLHRGKRHPTLEDGVIVGAGAKILGAFTVGRMARIGANAVVLSAVEAGASVVGIPARKVGEEKKVEQKPPQFLPYGTPCDDSPDPVACMVAVMAEDIKVLKARLEELESRREAPRKPVALPMEVPGEEPREEAAGGRR
ncbi:MAG TPA: serine O-acetyltransferase [Stellaceae bacterium]|nr:serine O-acetyltransferase [Stellaceae bacterium]